MDFDESHLLPCQQMVFNQTDGYSDTSNSVFLNFGILTLWAAYFFVVGGCPLYCRMFSSILFLYPLDIGNIPFSYQLWQPKSSADLAKCSLAGKITPGLEATAITQGGWICGLLAFVPKTQQTNSPFPAPTNVSKPRRDGPVTPVGGAWLFWFGGGTAAHRLLAPYLLDAPTRCEKCRAFSVQMARAA